MFLKCPISFDLCEKFFRLTYSQVKFQEYKPEYEDNGWNRRIVFFK